MQYLNPYIELCLEGSLSVFKGLNQKDKEALAENHSYTIYKRGALIFKEGEKTRGLICLASGKVKVFKEGAGGRDQIIKMVKQQGIIGYRTLFTENIHSFSAAAIEETAICIFEKNTVLKILKKNSDLSLKFMKVIAEELGVSNLRTVSLTQKHIRGRLAEALLILRDTYGVEADGMTLQVSLPREDIASLSNMTTSNAIRTLSNFASESIIELKGRKIIIADSKILEYISELG